MPRHNHNHHPRPYDTGAATAKGQRRRRRSHAVTPPTQQVSRGVGRQARAETQDKA